MAKFFTTDTLIESVKRRAMIPENQQTFQEVDFLAFANEEMDLGIIPHVLSFHEEYFVFTELITILPNQNRYEIPSRAVGNKLRELAYQDVSDNIFEMTRIKIDDLPSYQNNAIQYAFNRFYVEGNDIVLVPEVGPAPSGFLRFSYYLRPNELVSEDRVAIITGINTVSGDISVNSVPTVISISNSLDLIQTGSAHKTLALDLNATSINNISKIISFDPDDLPTGLSIGDQISLSGETIVPQIPSDLHSMLAQRVAARCLEALGDVQGLGSANAKLAEMEIKTGSLIDDRVEGAPLKMNNRHSILKQGRFRRRF